MKFDVNRFLAITAVLAGAGVNAAGCTVESTSDGDAGAGADGPRTGGSGRTGAEGGSVAGGAQGEGGSGGTADAGATSSGEGGDSSVTGGDTSTGGDPGSEGGEAGYATTGGASAGEAGEPGTGGTAGEGGQGVQGGYGAIGTSGAGGEGGEAGATTCFGPDDPGVEFPCDVLPTTDCDPNEEILLNPVYDTCNIVGFRLRPAAAAALADCLAEIGDPCAEGVSVDVQWCLDWLDGRGCASTTGAQACTTIQESTCVGLTSDACASSIELFTESEQSIVAQDCMDPGGEYYDPAFEGTCSDRFEQCSGLMSL